MGRKKDPARKDVLIALESGGAHTLKQIADETKHSTRTVSLHLKELVKSGLVKRLDLRLSSGYPKNVPKVFYQIDALVGPKVPDPHISFIIRKGTRLETIPMFRKGLTPFGRSVVDERAWFSRTNPRYKIKRPWSKARETVPQ